MNSVILGGGTGLIIGGLMTKGQGLSPSQTEIIAGISMLIGASVWGISDVLHDKLREISNYEKCKVFLSTSPVAQGAIRSIQNIL